MKVCELLQPKSVLLQARIDGQDDALGILVELEESGGVITNGTAYYNAVCAREASGGTTAIGDGIALPHACNAGVAAPGLSALTLEEGIDWGAPDGRPVDLVFMLAVPPGQESLRLLLLARLVNLMSNEELVRLLRSARTPAEFIEKMSRIEQDVFA